MDILIRLMGWVGVFCGNREKLSSNFFQFLIPIIGISLSVIYKHLNTMGGKIRLIEKNRCQIRTVPQNILYTNMYILIIICPTQRNYTTHTNMTSIVKGCKLKWSSNIFQKENSQVSFMFFFLLCSLLGPCGFYSFS